MDTMSPNKIGSEGSERDGLVRSEQTTAGGGEDKSDKGKLEYFGWVYHLGVNSIGHEYCHLRFLFIRGKYVAMYKCDPLEKPGNKPIRKGAVGSTLMVEDLGRRNVNNKDVYVLRFYNRLDESKKGEIACATAGEAQKWMEAFEHAKQQCEKELARGGSARHTLNMETEINLEGHRPRVRRYAYELRKLIKIGQGHETLMPQPSELGANLRPDGYFDKDAGDVIETHAWMCVRTISGVRILEDVADSQSGKGILVKSVGVVDANADTAFEVVMNIERSKRYEWDTLTCDLELVDSYDGHYDVVYGMYDPKYLSRWHSKRDFVFSRRWFRGQDGTYTILQFPTEHKKKPPRSGYRRTKINPSTWEIRNLNTLKDSSSPKCLVTQTLEINSDGWCRWKKYHCSKFEKSIPYALLTQVAGLKEYIGVNPALKFESFSTVLHSKVSDSDYGREYEEVEVQDEFYDAIAEDSSSSSEDEEDEYKEAEQGTRLKLKSVSLAISGLALKRTSAPDANKVLDPNAHPILIDPSQFSGSFLKGKDEADTNCWTSPSGMGFMIRGKNYLKDNLKVMGGDPLLTLLTADWLQVDKPADRIALDPKSLVQSESGKKLPFILIINLQVPAKPNYSLVLYYAADRSLNANSLLAKFVDGSDSFRDSRFKLIPSIVEGYWMVKRAVGTKACLLGKAVKCKYFRQDNFLEYLKYHVLASTDDNVQLQRPAIDVDIGSSSVARSVIGLVLGYVTSIVVDLAILIEAKEEEELPEFILGTVRLNRVRLDSAVPLEA